jgi:hypothetical protein
MHIYTRSDHFCQKLRFRCDYAIPSLVEFVVSVYVPAELEKGIIFVPGQAQPQGVFVYFGFVRNAVLFGPFLNGMS